LHLPGLHRIAPINHRIIPAGRFIFAAALALLSILLVRTTYAQAALNFSAPSTPVTNLIATDPPCEQPGWFPENLELKDHSVFWYNGYYYIVSISLPDETSFAYGRSSDLCNWEQLPSILTERTPGTWDERFIWAPSVYMENGIYYLYYTGVMQFYTQSIMLATSDDPADPASWQVQGMIFQPDHAGTTWQAGKWADCRDATIIKDGNDYYLYYSASDQEGGIIGMATSISPVGPWEDWGHVIPPVPGTVPESPTIYYRPSIIPGNELQPFSQTAYFYLFYHLSGQAESYRIGATQAGPWSEPFTLLPGWAHEVWNGQDGLTYTSYLTDYSITISQLTWNTYYDPPHPFIGADVHRCLLPLVTKTVSK
jgi:hypothetical protein